MMPSEPMKGEGGKRFYPADGTDWTAIMDLRRQLHDLLDASKLKEADHLLAQVRLAAEASARLDEAREIQREVNWSVTNSNQRAKSVATWLAERIVALEQQQAKVAGAETKGETKNVQDLNS